MQQIILITGSTDGIGFEAAKMLVEAGHDVLLHGRSPDKLKSAMAALSKTAGGRSVEGFVADLSRMADVERFAGEVSESRDKIDVLINNAGVYTPGATTADGLDNRFAVNAIAPYLLTRLLLPTLGSTGHIINVSSAAQAPVDLKALAGPPMLADGAAYAQSKLAITMWSRYLAASFGDAGPVIISVNPASMLGSKMVKNAFGVAGGDIRIGAEILLRLAVESEFGSASGKYFDNDIGQFGPPHADALNDSKCAQITDAIEIILTQLIPSYSK